MQKISTFRQLQLKVTSGWLMTDHATAFQLTYLTAFRLFYQKLQPNILDIGLCRKLLQSLPGNFTPTSVFRKLKSFMYNTVSDQMAFGLIYRLLIPPNYPPFRAPQNSHISVLISLEAAIPLLIYVRGSVDNLPCAPSLAARQLQF